MPSTQTAPTIEQVELKPSQLVPHKKNIRRDVGDVSDLADSVRAKGVLQPLVVVPNGQPDNYVIIAGHRRHAAAKAAKVKTVPCVIRHDLTDEKDQIAVMMVENGQRTDLTAVEEAKGVQTLLDLGDTQKQIAERTGMSATKVRQRAKVAKLPDDLCDKLTAHAVTLDDAVFLAEHSEKDDREVLEEALGTNNWGVAKQQVLNRAAYRKQVAATRKAVENQGFDIIDNWVTRRQRNAEIAKDLGVTSANDLVRKEFKWPPPAVGLKQAVAPDSRAFVWMADEWVGYRTEWSEGGYKNTFTLVVLSAPKPQQENEEREAESSNPDSPGVRPDSEHTASHTEPSSEAKEMAARSESLQIAATVRRQFLAQVIRTGDEAAARQVSQLAAKALRVSLDGRPALSLDEEQFPDSSLLNMLQPDDTGTDVERRLDALLLSMLATSASVSTSLLVWTFHYLMPVDTLMTEAAVPPHRNLDGDSMRVLVDYIDLIESLGHVLSDIETDLRDKIHAQMAEDSGE